MSKIKNLNDIEDGVVWLNVFCNNYGIEQLKTKSIFQHEFMFTNKN